MLLEKAKFHYQPSLVVSKAKQIAIEVQICPEGFKALWRWLSNFRKRMGIGRQRNVSACGKEVNKEDPALLAKLETLYNLFGKYDPSNLYNMVKQVYFIGCCQHMV